MENHNAEGIVITCIDFRFQEYIHKWLIENFQPGTYDRGAFAGAAKNLDTILSQVEVSVKLHNIKKAVIINHEDCGAYGSEGTINHHIRDLKEVQTKVKEKFPALQVATYYLHLDGSSELVN